MDRSFFTRDCNFVFCRLSRIKSMLLCIYIIHLIK